MTLFVNDNDVRPFRFIEPPFQFNHPDVARYPVEVSGYRMLAVMARRLGWPSLSHKRILDYGCGVRFARTIVNLDIDIGAYVGVDVNSDSIGWLSEHISDPRMRFVHLDDRNAMYNPNGQVAAARLPVGSDFDVACMFSVITHQNPPEARRTLVHLRETLEGRGTLYLTALLDESVADYAEAHEQPGLLSTYRPDHLVSLLEDTGWKTSAIFRPVVFQQHALICHCGD